ncbi:MAG: iron permease [Deltaproteobacteria bacterium]|nr:MAG: iron permease [Deltaproteobacteria bacterium]
MRFGNFFGLVCFVYFVFLASLGLAVPDYDRLAGEINTRLNKGAELYRNGDLEGGKTAVQMAYFEVFENLEGPIRINVSAAVSFDLESQFGEIRKMMIAGTPAGEVQDAVDKLNSGIADALKEVKAAGHSVTGNQDMAKVDISSIDPVWLDGYKLTEKLLHDFFDAYVRGNYEESQELLTKAQFEGYKNTLLETGIRRGISSKRDYHYNNTFTELHKMVDEQAEDSLVREKVNTFLSDLLADTQGLPMVDKALTDRQRKERERAASPAKDWEKINADLFIALDKALVMYGEGETDQAKAAVQNSYFDIFEASGMEQQVAMGDNNLKLEMEGYFTRLVAEMKAGKPLAELQKTAQEMKSKFTAVASEMNGKGESGFVELFLLSLLIIVREGFEAILVITALIAYMVKSGNQKNLKTVYSACIWAILLSLVTAWVLKGVFNISAAGQEILEGATMLLAVVVLFFVGHWLISKAEAGKWDKYIKSKMDASISRGSLLGLWFAAFLAVYREGAETVLFYFALMTQTSGASGNMAVLLGFICGSVALVIIYLVMRYSSVRLPYRAFFLFTGGLLYLMAFVFTGKGIMEFVEGKVFEPTLVPGVPQITILGIYPYVESLLPQLFLLLMLAGGWFYNKKRKKDAAV